MRRLVVGLLLCICALPAAAQDLAPSESACTYDECALRIEPTFLGGIQLVRGLHSEPVGRLGLFGSCLSDAVRSSEQATIHARAYESKRAPAFWAILGGLTLSVAAGVVSNSSDSEALEVGLLIGGVGLSALGVHYAIQAQQERERAVWWYNRDLAR